MDKHELTYIYADRGHHIGDNIYIGDCWRCTCGKEFQTCGRSDDEEGGVPAAFEHGRETEADLGNAVRLYSVSVDSTGYSGDYNDVLIVTAADEAKARRLAEEYAVEAQDKPLRDGPFEVTHSEAHEWAAGPRVLGPLDMEG